MKVNLLISTIFPRLCERALLTASKHGTGEDVMPVITGPEPPKGDVLRFVRQEERKGSNAANRIGLEACDDDAIIVLAADDVVFWRGWLGQLLPKFLAYEAEMGDVPFLMGIRHVGGIGTTYGHMYANFPMFRKSMLEKFPRVAENFCPPWLVGQWGDCAFGMSVWREGGKVLDSDTEPMISWSDRMGYPESPMKYAPMQKDTEAFQQKFSDFSQGWPNTFRGFNIDCPPAILENHTVCISDHDTFVARYNQCR